MSRWRRRLRRRFLEWLLLPELDALVASRVDMAIDAYLLRRIGSQLQADQADTRERIAQVERRLIALEKRMGVAS